jgi:hypothetical protein
MGFEAGDDLMVPVAKYPQYPRGVRTLVPNVAREGMTDVRDWCQIRKIFRENVYVVDIFKRLFSFLIVIPRLVFSEGNHGCC